MIRRLTTEAKTRFSRAAASSVPNRETWKGASRPFSTAPSRQTPDSVGPPSAARDEDRHSVTESFQTLERLLQEQHASQKDPLVVHTIVVAKALDRWKSWHERDRTAWTTDAVVARMGEYQTTFTTIPVWDRSGYSAILSGYRLEGQRSKDPRTAAARADAFLRGILQGMSGTSRVEGPTGKHLDTLLELHLTAGNLDGAKQLLEFLLHQCSHGKKEDRIDYWHQIRVSTTIFDRLLQACVTLPRIPNRGGLADAFLNLLLQMEQQKLLKGGFPRTEHYTQVVSAWARSQDPQGAQRVLQIWQYLHQDAHYHHRHPKKHPLAPDSVLTGAVLNALAQLGKADQAEKLLLDIMSHPKMERLRPDLSGFNAVLHAWAKAQDSQAGERAERLLRRMQREWSPQPQRGRKSRFDVVSYTSVIHAWGTSGHPDGPQRAALLFDEMLTLAETTDPHMEPNTITYISLLNAYAKAGDVPRAAQLLGTMCTNYSEGKSSKAIPTEHCFGVVLDAMARSGLPESGQAAEALLQKMEASGEVTPTAICYNIVINAWARSGQKDAGRHAEDLLRKMQHKVRQGEKNIAPGPETYNSVINAWTKSRCAEDAERVFREFKDICKTESSQMKVDRLSYHAVMNAHTKDGNPERTEALLVEMKAQGGHAKPDPESFRLCMEAWARSGRPDGGEKADSYLEQLDRDYPNEKVHRLEMRYKLAHMAWRNSLRHGHPRANQRLRELAEILVKIQAEKETEKPSWRRR